MDGTGVSWVVVLLYILGALLGIAAVVFLVAIISVAISDWRRQR